MVAVVLDTDFLSSFLKIDQLSLVRAYFQVDRLFVPVAVYREIAATDLLNRLNSIPWISSQEISATALAELERDTELVGLGAGEREAITLARQLRPSVLLMSDKKAIACARQAQVDVVDVPAFLLMYRHSEAGSGAQVQQLVEALEEKDYYGFSKEIRETLVD